MLYTGTLYVVVLVWHIPCGSGTYCVVCIGMVWFVLVLVWHILCGMYWYGVVHVGIGVARVICIGMVWFMLVLVWHIPCGCMYWYVVVHFHIWWLWCGQCGSYWYVLVHIGVVHIVYCAGTGFPRTIHSTTDLRMAQTICPSIPAHLFRVSVQYNTQTFNKCIAVQHTLLLLRWESDGECGYITLIASKLTYVVHCT